MRFYRKWMTWLEPISNESEKKILQMPRGVMWLMSLEGRLLQRHALHLVPRRRLLPHRYLDPWQRGFRRMDHGMQDVPPVPHRKATWCMCVCPLCHKQVAESIGALEGHRRSCAMPFFEGRLKIRTIEEVAQVASASASSVETPASAYARTALLCDLWQVVFGRIVVIRTLRSRITSTKRRNRGARRHAIPYTENAKVVEIRRRSGSQHAEIGDAQRCARVREARLQALCGILCGGEEHEELAAVAILDQI